MEYIMQDIIKIHQNDNVAVALKPIEKGTTLNTFQEVHFLEITGFLVLQTHALCLMQSLDHIHIAA